MSTPSPERSSWLGFKDDMRSEPVTFGRHVAYWLRKSPRRLLHHVAYYKFAAKMISSPKAVLDVGCAEGLGTWLLAKECGQAHGVDFDADAIAQARKNWDHPSISFQCASLQEADLRTFDAAVSFDVIEHVPPDGEDAFLDKLAAHLVPDAVCVVGTPSEASQAYASDIAKAGHVNIHSAARLEEQLLRRFRHVFLFSAHDEVVHTGFLPLAHYLIALACRKR